MNKLKVVFLSDWLTGNPYKIVLAEHLKPKNVQIEEYLSKTFFLSHILRNGRPDILHIHTLQNFVYRGSELASSIRFLVFAAQLFILRLLDVKIVWTVHDLSDKIYDGTSKIPTFNAVVLGSLFSSIVAHCETTKRKVIDLFYLSKEKAYVIPHGNYIDCYENSITQADARSSLGVSPKDVVFLLFGSVHPYKGVLEVIDAFKQLNQSEISLVIAGQPQGNQISESILNKIEGHNNIHFVARRIPDQEIQVFMNACNYVLLPYKVFTTSGVAILAMSYGRACIAPNSGFFKDVLDARGAILYESEHETGLIQALRDAVAKQDEAEQMGEHNLNLAHQCNWDFVAAQTFEVYQQCLMF